MTQTQGIAGAGRRPFVGSIVQAVAVLRYLGATERAQGVTAIAAALRISPSSCFNVLKTLVAEGLVEFDEARKTYSLGLGTIDLARSALRRDPVIAAARDGMRALARRYDATVGLWRVAGRSRLILVDLAESEATTRIHMVVGQRQPIAAGATGRCVAAVRPLPRDELEQQFAQLRWQQAPTLDAYLAQVREAREQGWAIDVDQFMRGISTVAAPIVDGDGAVRFCLSASMFTGQHPAERVREVGRAVRDSARAVAASVYGAR